MRWDEAEIVVRIAIVVAIGIGTVLCAALGAAAILWFML